MAERWAQRAYAAALRAGCVLVGSTFAAHRLSQRLAAESNQTGYFEAVWAAARPERQVIDDLVRSGLLATLAIALGLLIGLLVGRLDSPSRPLRADGLEPWTALALAIAVPGLLWWPLARAASEFDLLPDDPAVVDQGGLAAFRFLGFWALLAARALVPPVVAAAGSHHRGHRPGGPVNPLGRATMASRPVGTGRWWFGVPTLTFGLALAAVELLSGHRGLITRFVAALDAGDAGDVMAVVVPVAILGALLTLIASWPFSSTGSGPGDRTAARRSRPGDALEPLNPGSPAVLAMGVLGSALVFATLVGLLLDPAASTETALSAPRFGGPWFGTDGEGRDVGALTLVALGPTLVAVALPAIGAALVGWGLATARARQNPNSIAADLTDAAVDLAWWPAMLLVPLAVMAVGAADQPLLHPTVLLTTGLILVPLSARLQAPAAEPGRSWPQVGATGLFLASLALALHLIVGFMTTPLLAAPDGRLLLGQVGANGLEIYDDRALALIGPLAVAAALGFVLALGAQIVSPQARMAGVRHRVVDHPDHPSTELDDGAAVGDPLTTIPLGQGPAFATNRLVSPPGPTEEIGYDAEPGLPINPRGPEPARPSLNPPGPPAAPAPPAAPVLPERPTGEPEADIRLLVTASTTIDILPPTDDDAESSSVLEEATRTIELRPSYFRPPPEHQ